MLRGWDNIDAKSQAAAADDDVDESTGAMNRQEDLHRRQENNSVEISIEDPLASPGNSSLNSGHFGGWSIGPGMVDKESVDINPYEDDDDDEEYETGTNEVANTNRSSSPRESLFTAHGLSMVKEDARRGDDTNPESPGNNNFDDVDLEAFPPDSSTTRNKSRQNNNTNGNNYGMKGNIANRVVQEFQTNPKFKFQVLVGLSMLLVASCLIAVLVGAPDGHRQSISNEQNKAVDLSELLDGLQSSTPKPTSSPTKVHLTGAPTVKKTTKPVVILTEYPTLLPTMYPTFSTLNPSADTSLPLNTSSPGSLAETNSSLTTSAPSSMLDSAVVTKTQKPSPTPQMPTLQPPSDQITNTPTSDCSDSSGEFMTHNDKPRTCEWLDNGFNGAKSDRKDMNCKKSDLGDACKYTCRLYNGCMEYFLQSTEDFNSERDFSIGDACADKEGSFISNGDVPRTCNWLEEDPETAATKKDLNCGTPDNARTELGTMCPGSCVGYNECKSASDDKVKNRSEDEAEKDATRFKVDALIDDTAVASTDIPSFFPTVGKQDEKEDASVITIATLADSTVSQKYDDKNFGDSKRLNVEHDADGNASKERQALLLFDLSSAGESFKDDRGKATLHIYSVTGAEYGGIILKKMSSSDWTEDDVKWKNVPGGDGSDEMLVSSLGKLESNTWYDIDATAAVRDAIKKKETHLGIRIVSDESVDLYFGSKEREKEQPVLVIDPNAAQPPTEMPTSGPTVLLDCMDQMINFEAHTGETQECSWLNSGDEAHRKELNFQNEGDAAFICQSSCSMYNGCDDLHCIALSGNYATHNGWTAPCSWLQTEDGLSALEMNCGGSAGYVTTELGQRCQASCGEYNGCSDKAKTKQLDGVPVETAPTAVASSSPTSSTTTLDTVEDGVAVASSSPTSSTTTLDTVEDVAVFASNSPTFSTTILDTVENVAVPVDTAPDDASTSPTFSTTSSETMIDDAVVAEFLTNIPTFAPTAGEVEDVVDNDAAANESTNYPTFMPTPEVLNESEDEDVDSQSTNIPTYFPSTTGTAR